MTENIPASAIVNVTPNVIGAGGTGLDLSGLILTANTSVPIGSVATFADEAGVSDFFGPLADETLLAAIYFGGFDGSNVKPAALLFAQYPTAAVPAYLRSGSLAAMTLAQLQALSPGTLAFTVDGQAFTSASINLSAASSFSNAAALIQTGLAHYDAVVTGSIATTTLTVTAVASGTLVIGQTISGAGVTAGTIITALGTGTGGTGTYTVSVSQTASSTTISAGPTTVTYSAQLAAFIVTGGTPGAAGSVSFATTGALATGLKLTAATGAVQSGGAAIGVPGTAMDAVVAQTQNFATFMTLFKPSIADMVLFAAWTNGTGNRYAYAMWDNDVNVTLANPTSSAGYLIGLVAYSGTIPIYDPANGSSIAAFTMGAVASIDFAQADGRTNIDLRSQSGLVPGVTSATIRTALIANGYNFYGAFATANDQFIFFNPGSLTGPFAWIDSYVNQIWMNNGFQLALMSLLTAVRSIPYNSAGYGLIEAAMIDQVDAAVNFGAIRAGVSLSTLQAAEVNAAAGLRVSDTIEQRGWYIQVANASPTVRTLRGSPPVTFWYTDGQSVQTINLASVEVQ